MVFSNWRLTMVRNPWMLVLAVVIALLVPQGQVLADVVVVGAPPAPYYYCPPPVTTYYSAPVVYAPAPTPSYYYGVSIPTYTPSVSYYAAPAYAAPGSVTTVYCGLLGRPRAITSYYPPAYIGR